MSSVAMNPMRRKLIEVALPLDAINVAAAREKSIRHGHPSTLHLWWARRPLAAARAVIFAQMVDDPSEYVDVLLSDPAKKRAAARALKRRKAAGKASVADLGTTGSRTRVGTVEPADRQALGNMAAEIERERLFGILQELVRWENTTNEKVLEQARTEIRQSWRRACAEHADHPRATELFDRHTLPAFHDPFAGGGSLPLEAQRLGLKAHASDLNPVAVLINKAMIEIPPRFAGRPPVNPESRGEPTVVAKTWRGAQGLAEDVRYYGRWMRDEAKKRIGHLYPTIEITPAMVRERPDLKPYEGRKLTVIAWLWARTVKSPNPAFADVDVPLASTFMLSTKKGREAYVEPVIEGRGYRFTVRVGAPPDAEAAKAGTKLSRGANFRCLMSGSPIAGDYIKAEGRAGRMGARLMAIVAEGNRGRVYWAPTAEHEGIACAATSEWQPVGDVPARLTGGTCVPYGLTTWADLFTPRQLVALTTFSELAGEATRRVRRDAAAAGLPDDERPLRDGGTGATAYAEAVGVYLAFAQSKAADRNTSLCVWEQGMGRLRGTFSRQALPMVRGTTQRLIRSRNSAGWGHLVAPLIRCMRSAGPPCHRRSRGSPPRPMRLARLGAPARSYRRTHRIYDNIGYADLSDFFYVWLRRSLRPVFPKLVRDARRAEGRRAGGYSVPPRQQGSSRDLLPRRHDTGAAPSRGAGASGVPRHHLLRLQAIRNGRGIPEPRARAGRRSWMQ